VVPLVLVAAIAAGVYFWMKRGPGQTYPADGEVRFNGKPVVVGYLDWRPLKKSNAPTRIIAPIDTSGKFDVWSEIDSRLVKGAPAGDYKVLLVLQHPPPGLGAPAPMLEPKYYDEASTPIKLTISSDPSKNHFVVDETGELLPDTARRGSPPPAEAPPEEASSEKDAAAP
jgi:hypothetical protein